MTQQNFFELSICEWCGVNVQRGEQSALAPKYHRWCVVAVVEREPHYQSIGERIVARRIRNIVEAELNKRGRAP